MPRRHPADQFREAARGQAGARAAKGGERHAAERPARLRHAEEAQGLRGRHASPFGPAAETPRDLGTGMVGDYYYGTGRRKSAVARVFLKPGKGQFVVNGKPVDEFFGLETGRMVVRQPLELTMSLSSSDIMVNVYGGGESGQAGAVGPRLSPALIGDGYGLNAALYAAGLV